MTTLDRQLFFAYIRSYLIVWTSLLSLYVIVDLFTNLDDFGSRGGLMSTIKQIGGYYSYRISQIFDKLSEAISLLAAVFTVSWMQRSNELLPQLSAGVSTRRVIRPILFGAMLTIAMGPLNQEFIIPRIADALITPRNDPESQRAVEVKGAFDGTGVHVEGVNAFRKEQRVEWMYFTFPENGAGGMLHLSAAEGIYSSPTADDPQGYWTLYKSSPATIEGAIPPTLEPVSPGVFRVKTRNVDFEMLTRGGSWYTLASTPDLLDILGRPDPRRLAPVAVLFHTRIVRPVVGFVLVLLGLGVILGNQNRHVLVNVGLCVAMCATYYACVYGSKYLGDQDLIAPVLAAWLPVLIFGPVAVVLIDAVHT